jgi:hypothetical protein
MNSDYAPVLDQNAVRTRFLFSDARALLDFQKRLFPTVELLSGIGLPGAVTSVTPSLLFQGSRRAGEAMWLRNLLLKQTSIGEQLVESRELHDHARALSQWMADCERRPVPLTSLVRVLQAMVADLTPGDLDGVWWALSSSGCARHFSEQDRNWIAVLQAIGRRDGARMAEAARHLLAAEPDLGASSERYLVAAGMLGSIAQGRPADARDLWARHERSLGPGQDLLLRVLVARSRR